MISWFFLLFLGGVIHVPVLLRADERAASGNWEARQWLRDSGLPDNSVTCLLQTRDKFLWVGTRAGLARFDGNEFNRIIDRAGHALRITCLCEDTSASLWVGTQDAGMFVVSNATLMPLSGRLQFTNQDITSITQDTHGDFWIGTSDGLVRIQNGAATRFGVADGLPDDFISAIHCARSGTLWVTTRQGICELQQGHFMRLDVQTQGLGPHPEFLGVYEDDQANVWVFGDTFLVNLKDGKRLNNFRGGDIASYRIWSLCEGRDGRLWISTSGQGIFSFANGHFTPVAFRDRMLSSDVRTVLEDDSGNIWLGTFGGGLVRMRQRLGDVLGESSGLPAAAATCAVTAPDGRLYVGFLQGGLYYGNRNRFEPVGRKSGFETENLVTSLCVDRTAALWIGTYGDGVYQLGESTSRHWTTAEGLADNVVSALCADLAGRVWLGGRSGNLQRIDGNTLAVFDQANGLPGSAITCLSANGNEVLVGTESGNVLCSEGGAVIPLTATKLPGKAIRALFKDGHGRVWIGADNAGLMCVAGDQARQYDGSDGFPDTDVRGLVEDTHSNIWVSAARGIWMIQGADFSAALPSAINSQQFYAEATGLPAARLPGSPQAAAANDKLYFVSGQGLIELNPGASVDNNRDLRVSLQQVSLNNAPLAINTPLAGTVLELPSPMHSMEFRFTAVDLGFPEKLHFQHLLEGFDSGWVDNGNERVVDYGRLPYGRYRFKIRVSRGDNNWYETNHPFAFQLEPPWWRSYGAVALYAVIGLGLITLGIRQIFHRRFRRTLTRLTQQQAMEKERMRIAQNMHDEIGSKLTRISFLSELAIRGKETAGENIVSIATTSRKLLQTLDEIVWAVNPQNDSVEYLAAYFGHYANEYFQSTDVSLNLKIPDNLPDVPVSSECRHNLFLAFEEALGNVLKHSRATRVRVEMQFAPPHFTIVIEDNGCGFTPPGDACETPYKPVNGLKRVGNGLRNMKKRLDEIGGSYQIDSLPGRGTTVTLQLFLSTRKNHE